MQIKATVSDHVIPTPVMLMKGQRSPVMAELGRMGERKAVQPFYKTNKVDPLEIKHSFIP